MEARQATTVPPLPKEKFEKVADLLDEMNCEAWIVMNGEHFQDPLAENLGSKGRTALVFERSGKRTAITAKFHVPPIEATGIYTDVVGTDLGIIPEVEQIVKKYDGKKIALNISTEHELAGSLSHPTYGTLRKLLPNSNFVSSDSIVIYLRTVLNEEEIQKLIKAVLISEEIMKEARDDMQIGTSRKELFDRMQRRFVKKNVGYGWADDENPLIVIGPREMKETFLDATIEAGNVVMFDLGANYHGYVADIGNTYFVPGGDYKQPSSEMERMFRTVRQAVDAGKEKIRAGVLGVEVDTAVRSVIKKAGYAEYDYPSGHVFAHVAHEIGPLLAPDWPTYSTRAKMPLLENMAMAIEPSVFVPNVGTVFIEENVLVTKGGHKDISSRQEELWIV
jgi:Xaa-Pro aminopeptidase